MSLTLARFRVPHIPIFNSLLDGIDHLISTPRDIVRICNTLGVTYPTVRGHVNGADFIAIESLRVFQPDVYELIRQNEEYFVGDSEEGIFGRSNNHLDFKPFHDAWVQALPETHRAPVQQLVQHLFPRLASVWSNNRYGSQWLATWRRAARVCTAEHFSTYFRLAVPITTMSPAEMSAMLALISDPVAFSSKLLELAGQKTPAGTTRVRTALELLEDYTTSLPESSISSFVEALLSVGDRLLLPEDEPIGILTFGNDVRIGRLVFQVLRRLEEPARYAILREAMTKGTALSVIVRETAILGREHGRFGDRDPRPENEWELTLEHTIDLETLVLDKIRWAAAAGALLSTPDLEYILYRWREWAGAEEPAQWVQKVARDDYQLPALLSQFLRRRVVQQGDRAPRAIYRLDPRDLAKFVDPATIISRARHLLEAGGLSDGGEQAIQCFVREYDLLGQGIDPDQMD